jgi:hypothetical protein
MGSGRSETRRSISAADALAVLRTAADTEFNKGEADQQWTPCVLRALAELGKARGHCIDPDVTVPRVGKGRAAKEFLWDLTISSWPKYGKPARYVYPDYFIEAARRAPRLLLVAESEWGAANGRTKNGMAVLEDFSKLLAARADVKVMVFGYFTNASRSGSKVSTFDDLTSHMVTLIRKTGDDASYALFGVAWDAKKYEDMVVTGKTPAGMT